MGFALKVLRPNAAVVYDVHEDYPAMMRVKYWLPPLLRPLISGAAWLANAAAGLILDGVVTADPGVQRDFQRFARITPIVYYNFPTLSLFQRESNNANHSNSKGAKVDLVYIGGMSERAGTFVLLDALALLAQKGIKPTVRLAGYTDGDDGQLAIHHGIQKRGLSGQIELVGRLPHHNVPAWIKSGRAGLVTLEAIPKFMKNIPSKMFEYWACGLSVVASDLPPIRQFLTHGENGLLFEPSNAADLARVIRELIEVPHESAAMGRRGQDRVFQEWNNERQVEHLIDFYQRICGSPA